MIGSKSSQSPATWARNWLASSSVTRGGALVDVTYSATGAVAVNLRKWIMDDGSYNVMGFIPDALKSSIRNFTCTTDVTPYLQLAHDACSSSGGSVFIPIGLFPMLQTAQASQFTISKSYFKLHGAGPGSVLAKLNTGVVVANQAIIMLRPLGAHLNSPIVENLRISGPSTNSGALPPGTNNVVGILIHDGTNGAANNYDILDARVSNVIIHGMETAAYCLTDGFGTGRNKRSRFINCVARNGRQDGFNDFGGGSQETSFENCHAFDLDGFGHEHGGHVHILGGSVARVGQAGIGLEYNATLSPDRHNVVQGVHIHDIGTTGSPDAAGISLGQSVSPNNTHIKGNVIQRVGGHGIQANITPTNIRISNNDIKDVGRGGINKRGIQVSAGSRNHIIGNTITTESAGYAMDYGIVNQGTDDSDIIAENEVNNAAVQRIYHNGVRIRRGTQPYTSSAGVGNILIGEDDLKTYSIPATTLENDGQSLKIRMSGTTAANVNLKQVKVYFNGTAIFATGAVAANAKPWHVDVTVTRVSSSRADIHADGTFNGAVVADTYSIDGAVTWTAAIAIKTTGEATLTGDVTQNLLSVVYIDEPASP